MIGGSKAPGQWLSWGGSGFGLAWRGTGRFFKRREPAQGIADKNEVVSGAGRITAPMGPDGAMDFEVDNGVEPIAPELSGAAHETEGMAGLRDNWAASECFLDEERHLSTPEGVGETILVLDEAEQSIQGVAEMFLIGAGKELTEAVPGIAILQYTARAMVGGVVGQQRAAHEITNPISEHEGAKEEVIAGLF